MYFIYILRTSSNTLYTGYTIDLDKRLTQHADKSGKGSKYMRSFDSFTLVYTEEFNTKSEAMKREAEIKKLSKLQKEALISDTSLKN